MTTRELADVQNEESAALGGNQGVQPGGAIPDPERKVPETVRETIERTQFELAAQNDGEIPEPKEPKKPLAAKQADQAAVAPGAKAGDGAEQAAQGSEPTQSDKSGLAAKTAPPDSWNKDEKALWETVPPAVQKAVLRQTEVSAKGVEQLRSRYAEIEQAIAPFRQTIKGYGVTEAQAINKLFYWQMRLAANGPEKVQAFKELARNHGLDLSTLSDPANGQQGADQNAIPAALIPILNNFQERFQAWDQRSEANVQTSVNSHIAQWARGKDHFDAVRDSMMQLIAGGAVPTLEGGYPDLDAAYKKACYLNDEVREKVLADEQEKRATEARELADKARKAGKSLRPAAPIAPQVRQAPQGKPGESVRESIMRAKAELSAQ